MTHDPFQTYAMLGAYTGVPTLQPFTQPYYGQYPGVLNPLAQHPLQQLSSILAGQTNPLQGLTQHNPFGGFQQHNPFGGFGQNPLAAWQNPWIALQNPLLAATLHNPMLHPLLTQTIGQNPYQQGGYGGAIGTGYPLAPQSWIGPGVQTGQIHPLYQQLAARAFTPGINPWTGF